MIVYLDTSAVVPILIEEPTTTECRRVWHDADRRITSRLTYVEVSAALAAAERLGRLTADDRDHVWSNFTGLWPDVNVVELSESLIASAAGLTGPLALRGYDAVHCASALAVADPDLVAIAGDADLLRAWRQSGVSVVDSHA